MMNQLDADFPDVHERLLRVIRQVTSNARFSSLSAAPEDAADVIRSVASEIEEAVSKDAHIPIPYAKASEIAARVVAMMVGECPIDWR